MAGETDFRLFAQLTKVDEATRTVYGRATEEIPDSSREIIDIEKSWPRFEKWSSAAEKRSGGKSKGNVREMHEPIAAGKIIEMHKVATEDGTRAIDIGTYCSDENTWQKILDGTLTGFSIGGKYVSRRPDPKDPTLTRYVADPHEISYVDAPAVPTATYKFIKADGVEELRKFAPIPVGMESVAAPVAIMIEDNLEALSPMGVDDDVTHLQQQPAPSGNRVEEVPAVAGTMLSPAIAEVNGASPAPVAKSEDETELTKTAELLNQTITKIAELLKADEDKKEKILGELKQRGSSVGIAKREGGPLSAPSNAPEDWHSYADPANWAFPMGTPALCKSSLADYNSGKGREYYTTREWHVLGRRIARLASDTFDAKHQYLPTMQKVEREQENKMAKIEELQKADLMGLLSQVNAALTSAVDMMGKDPGAARSLLMSVLGNLDDASTSSSVSTADPSPEPPMNEQQDASVAALKAVASKPAASTPAASTPSASTPSASTPAPSAKTAEKADANAAGPSGETSSPAPTYTPSVPGDTGDAYTAMKAQVDAMGETVNKLLEMVTKMAQPADKQAEPVVKSDMPALDLNSIVDGISEEEDPIVKAVLNNDLALAEELASKSGGLTKAMNEAVQKSLSSKPFFAAGHRIYNPAPETPAE